MSHDDALTVLLPLKDRAAFTFRWMTYANQIELPFKVLIADGGKDESVERVLSRGDSYPNVSYEYVRYPYDESYTHYYKKLVDALSRIETPFVVLADNDDFYFADGLRRSVEFLERNPEYASCRGLAGSFKVHASGEDGLSRVYGPKVTLSIPDQPEPIADATAAQRVRRHFTHYWPTFYDVHWTEGMLTCFKRLRDLNPDNIFLAEWLTSFMTVAVGKVERAPFPYLIRQSSAPGSNAKTDRRKWGDYFDRVLLDTWSADFMGFVDSVGDVVSAKDGVSRDQARSQVTQGFRKFIAPHIVSSLSRDVSSEKKSPRAWIMNRIVSLDRDSKVRQTFGHAYHGFAAVRAFTGSLRPRARKRQMSLSRPSRFQDELKPVYEVLRSPPPGSNLEVEQLAVAAVKTATRDGAPT